VSEAQRKRMEARINDLGLDHERVKAWLHRASEGRVQHFSQLTPALYRSLDDRLKGWVERTATQEENP